MSSLRIILPHPAPDRMRERIFIEVGFPDSLSMRIALKATRPPPSPAQRPPSPPTEEVPIFLSIPVAEAPAYTREMLTSSDPWMDIMFETGVIRADDPEEQKKQNRKMTMGLLTGEVEPRDRRLNWAMTQEVLESKREPERRMDWDWGACELAPYFDHLAELERCHEDVAMRLEAMYERCESESPRWDEDWEITTPPPSPPIANFHGGKFLKRTLLSGLPLSSQERLGGWSDECSVMLLRLEPDGPLYDRISSIRALDTFTSKEFREVMAEAADRRWYDTVLVMRPNEDLPRNLRFARASAQTFLRWGPDKI